MTIKSIKNIKSWQGKRVFLRLDLNVPLVGGKIKDDYKIRASLDTIKFLLNRRAKLVLASHLGDPDGKIVQSLSLKPVAQRLRDLLGEAVFLATDFREATEHDWQDGRILMLENLRFWPEEKKNQATWAKKLSQLAVVYVNDAFAVSHRSQASVSAIKKYLPAYAGLLLEKELNNLNQLLNPQKPFVILMGGAKVSTKVPLLKNLEKKASQILLGGGLANTFLHFSGYQVGRSIYDSQGKKTVDHFTKKGKLSPKIILPSDLSVKNNRGQVLLRKLSELKKTDKIFDIGPETITTYCRFIKKAKTVVWNGPLGKFEEDSFKYGTLFLATMIASHSQGKAFGVVGGGETLEALKMTKMESYIDWISTGGGAMLAFLGGEEMPGLSKIVN